MKNKEEKLAQARAVELADRADSRSYQAGLLADNIKRGEENLQDDRAYSEEQQLEQEERGRVEAAAERGRDLDDEVRLRAQGLEDYKKKADIDTDNTMRIDAADTTSSGGKMNGSDKQLAMRSDMGGKYLDKYKSIVLGAGGQGIYDTSTMGAMVSATANKFDLGRMLTSAESQAVAASSEGMVAAILRTDTGAAAPEPEQIRYAQRLVPGVGEGPELVEWKVDILEATFAGMAAAAETGATPESIREAGLDAAKLYELDKPRPRDTGKADDKVQDERGNWLTPAQLAKQNSQLNSDPTITDLLKLY